MTVFNAGKVTSQQPGAIFDVALRQIPFFPQGSEAVANNHGAPLDSRRRGVVVIYPNASGGSSTWSFAGGRHGGAILRDFFFCDMFLYVYIRTDNLRYR